MAWGWMLQGCERLVNLVTALALLLCGSFGAYALWDNQQVLASAAMVREELLQWKPVPVEEGDTQEPGYSFDQLKKINPEVVAWITLDGTGIDHPVLQGANNLSYISRDVFGNFSLAGSIFLDSRDDPLFQQNYGLLYGHHMADGNMFGDLDKFKEEAFFRDNGSGLLLLPEKSCRLETAAVLVMAASEPMIFDPDYVRSQGEAWISYVKENALWLREETLGEGQYLALTTCSTEFTDARTVVLVRMEGVTE